MPKKKKQPRKPKTDPRGAFRGAEYLRRNPDMGLVDANGRENKHWSGIHSNKTGLVTDPVFRDIGHCLAFFMKESLQACSQIVYPEDADGNLALDTIGQFVAKIWNESLHDNLGGLCQFRSLYKRMEEIPGGTEAYAAWTHYFFQTYVCYLFTVKKMANGLKEGWLDETSEFNSMMLILNTLDDDLKAKVLEQLRDRGVWPSNISSSKLIRRLDDFLKVVIEGQDLRIKEQQEADEHLEMEDVRVDAKQRKIAEDKLHISLEKEDGE